MKQVGLSQICAAVRVEVVLLLLVATSFLTTGLSYLSAREPPHTRPRAHPLYPIAARQNQASDGARAYVPIAGSLESAAARLRDRYAADPSVMIAIAHRTGQLLVVAPPSVHRQIAQWTTSFRAVEEIDREPSQNLEPVSAVSHLPGCVYQLQHISWRDLEDMLSRTDKFNAPKLISGNGVLSTVSLPNSSDSQTSIQVNRGSNQVMLRGPGESVRGWIRVLQAVDQPPRKPNTAAKADRTTSDDQLVCRQAVSQLLDTPGQSNPSASVDARSALATPARYDARDGPPEKLPLPREVSECVASEPLHVRLVSHTRGSAETPRQFHPHPAGRLPETMLSNAASLLGRSTADSVSGVDTVHAGPKRPDGTQTCDERDPVRASLSAGDLSYLIPLVSFGVGFMCSLALAAMVLPSVVWRQSRRCVDDQYERLWADPRFAFLHPAKDAQLASGVDSASRNTTWSPPATQAHSGDCNGEVTSGGTMHAQPNAPQHKAMLERVFEQNLELRDCEPQASGDLGQGQTTVKSRAGGARDGATTLRICPSPGEET